MITVTMKQRKFNIRVPFFVKLCIIICKIIYLVSTFQFSFTFDSYLLIFCLLELTTYFSLLCSIYLVLVNLSFNAIFQYLPEYSDIK